MRNALEGNITTTYRDADESIDVVVKYDQGRLQTISDLQELLIATPNGTIVPLKDVAQVQENKGYMEIRRFENERAITVYARVDKEKISAVEANQALIQAFGNVGSMFPGYRLDFRGVFDQINESFAELVKLFVVGLLIIYVILGAQFKSFLQPIIILFAVPFGVIGAMVGLLAVGSTLSMIAMFGIVALAGIVINDSIVLIDFINRYRDLGYNKWRAILKAGSIRFTAHYLDFRYNSLRFNSDGDRSWRKISHLDALGKHNYIWPFCCHPSYVVCHAAVICNNS